MFWSSPPWDRHHEATSRVQVHVTWKVSGPTVDKTFGKDATARGGDVGAATDETDDPARAGLHRCRGQRPGHPRHRPQPLRIGRRSSHPSHAIGSGPAAGGPKVSTDPPSDPATRLHWGSRLLIASRQAPSVGAAEVHACR